MGTFGQRLTFIPRLKQEVYVNGSRSAILECVSISRDSAEFQVPEGLFDSRRDLLQDAFVVVGVFNEFTGEGLSTDFCGYLDVASATLTESDDSFILSATSITNYLGKVWVGQDDYKPVVKYALTPGWTPKRVLVDLFSKMPVSYRQRIQLGSTSALDDSPVIVPENPNESPSIVFRNATYASALDTILGYFGDVSYAIRYFGGVAYLDFYKVSSPFSPRTMVAIGNWGESPLDSNVSGIQNSVTSRDAVTRVRIYGAPRQAIISCFTDDTAPATRLQKDWNVSLEAKVILNPERAKPGSPGYEHGMEWVFRRFRLPVILHGLTKLKELPFKRANGSAYTAQAWYFPTILETDPTDPSKKIGVFQTTAVMESTVDWQLDKNQVIFSRPMINATGLAKDSKGKPKPTFVAAASVGITFAIELPQYLYHDTGHDYGSDVTLDIAADGLTEMITREDFVYAQYTTHGGYAVSGHNFGCMIFNEDAAEAQTGGEGNGAGPYWLSNKLVLRDDTKALRKLATEIQQERSRRHRSYSITVPYFTRAYREGYLVAVSGDRQYVPDNYMITSVSHDLGEDQSTKIECDNVRPPSRQEVSL